MVGHAYTTVSTCAKLTVDVPDDFAPKLSSIPTILEINMNIDFKQLRIASLILACWLCFLNYSYDELRSVNLSRFCLFVVIGLFCIPFSFVLLA